MIRPKLRWRLALVLLHQPLRGAVHQQLALLLQSFRRRAAHALCLWYPHRGRQDVVGEIDPYGNNSNGLPFLNELMRYSNFPSRHFVAGRRNPLTTAAKFGSGKCLSFVRAHNQLWSTVIKTLLPLVSVLALVAVPPVSIAQGKKTGVGAVFGALLAKGATGANGKPSQATMISALSSMANQLNKSMPMEIDSVTRLDNILASPVSPKFTYNYTLDATLQEIGAANFFARMKPTLIKGVCTTPDMKIFMENGVTVGYSYRTKDGAFAGKIDVSPTDCV